MRNPAMAIVFAAALGYGFLNTLWHVPSNKPVAIPEAAPGASPTAPRPIRENVVAYSTAASANVVPSQTHRHGTGLGPVAARGGG